MTKILYSAFDIVPSLNAASKYILHNLRGFVNGDYGVHLITPNEGLLPTEDTIYGMQVTQVT